MTDGNETNYREAAVAATATKTGAATAMAGAAREAAAAREVAAAASAGAAAATAGCAALQNLSVPWATRKVQMPTQKSNDLLWDPCMHVQPKKPCVYVAIIGLDPDVRFDKHNLSTHLVINRSQR